MMKKYTVSGHWHRTYFAKDETHANQLGQQDMKMISNKNIKLNIQEINEVDTDDS